MSSRWLLPSVVAVALGCVPPESEPAGLVEEVLPADSPLRSPDFTWARQQIVQIVFNDGSGCTGALVKDRIVLTAAHCVNYGNEAPGGKSHGKIWVHKSGKWWTQRFNGFRSFGRQVGGDDLALLHLRSPIDPNWLEPMPIANRRPPTGGTVTQYGYGRINCTAQGNGSNGEEGRFRKQRRAYAWGDAHRYSCDGDSGGPHLYRGRIVAVTSGHTSTRDINATVADDYARLHRVMGEWIPEARGTSISPNPDDWEPGDIEDVPPGGGEVEIVPPPPPDTTPPTVTIHSPVNGALVTRRVPVTVSASDNSGQVRVEFLADGRAFGSVGAPPYHATLETAYHGDGPVTIEAAAWDPAGNVSRTSVGVVIDDHAPTLTLSPNEMVVKGTVTLTAAAADPHLKEVQLFINWTRVGLSNPSGTSSTLTYAWDTTQVLDGEYSLLAIATDRVGNSSHRIGKLVVHNFNPTIKIKAPIANASYTGLVDYAADVTSPTLASVSFLSQAGNCAFGNVGPFACQVSVATRYDGPTSVQVKATDPIGNVVTQSQPYVVDNSPPQVNVLSPAPGTVAGRYLQLRATSPKAPWNATNSYNVDSITSLAFYARYNGVDHLLGHVTDGRYPFQLLASTPDEIPNGAAVSIFTVATDTVRTGTYTPVQRTATSALSTVTVDREVAGVQIIQPATNGNAYRPEGPPIKVVVDAWSGWGVASVDIIVRPAGLAAQEKKLATLTAAPFEYDVPVTGLLGKYELIARARFNEGGTKDFIRPFDAGFYISPEEAVDVVRALKYNADSVPPDGTRVYADAGSYGEVEVFWEVPGVSYCGTRRLFIIKQLRASPGMYYYDDRGYAWTCVSQTPAKTLTYSSRYDSSPWPSN